MENKRTMNGTACARRRLFLLWGWKKKETSIYLCSQGTCCQLHRIISFVWLGSFVTSENSELKGELSSCKNLNILISDKNDHFTHKLCILTLQLHGKVFLTFAEIRDENVQRNWQTCGLLKQRESQLTVWTRLTCIRKGLQEEMSIFINWNSSLTEEWKKFSFVTS